jgi:hypothetical protein
MTKPHGTLGIKSSRRRIRKQYRSISIENDDTVGKAIKAVKCRIPDARITIDVQSQRRRAAKVRSEPFSNRCSVDASGPCLNVRQRLKAA